MNVEKYLMMPFKDYGCSEFVEYVLNDNFKCNFNFPKPKYKYDEDAKRIIKYANDNFKKTNNPQEGDIVLMNGKYQACHVGVLIIKKGVKYVLHSEKSLGVSCLHRLSEIYKFNYFLNGFFSWR